MARKYLAGAAVVTATLLLGACSGNAGDGPPPTQGPQRLVHAIGADPDTVHPSLSALPQTRIVGCLVYQGLTRVDNEYQVQPQLAKSWDVSEDGRTYTFELEATTFTDGEPLTAHDVVYSIQELATLSPGFAGSAARLESVTEIDDDTVEVVLTEPFATFLQTLSCDLGGVGVVPARLYEGTDPATNPASLETPVGTGPFMLKSWQRGSQITLVRNPDYFRPGLPKLDEVVAKVLPSANGRMLSLMSGEVDYVYHYWVERSSLGPIESNDKFTVTDHLSAGDLVMVNNVRNEVLADPRVRQALFMAIDRDFLIDGPMKGYGEAGVSAIGNAFPWAHNPDVDLNTMYPYDPDAARKLLAEAGHGDGITLRLAFDAANPLLKPMADAIAEYWDAIGVTTTLQGSELVTVVDQVFKQWDYDVSLWGFIHGGDPATGIARLYVSSSIGTAPYGNASGFSDPEVDRLWAEGVSVLEQGDRAQPYFEVQEILAKQLPSVPLVHNASLHASVAGLSGMFDGVMQFGDWWDGVEITP